MSILDRAIQAHRPTEPRILVIDIETVPMQLVGFGLFKQNFSLDHIVEPGRTVCFAAQWYGEKKVHFHSEHHDGRQAMVEAAWDYLDRAHIVVGYNHRRFDIPHLQRCFIEAKMPAPSSWRDVDLLTTVRRQFRFDSAKLDWVAQQLGLGAKVKHDGISLWRGVMKDDPKAWAKFKRYCMADTALTTELYETLRPFIRNHPNVNLYRSERLSGCPTCGSDNVEPDRWEYTPTRAYRAFLCGNCGARSRATHHEPDMAQHRRGSA